MSERTSSMDAGTVWVGIGAKIGVKITRIGT